MYCEMLDPSCTVGVIVHCLPKSTQNRTASATKPSFPLAFPYPNTGVFLTSPSQFTHLLHFHFHFQNSAERHVILEDFNDEYEAVAVDALVYPEQVTREKKKHRSRHQDQSKGKQNHILQWKQRLRNKTASHATHFLRCHFAQLLMTKVIHIVQVRRLTFFVCVFFCGPRCS